MLYTKTNNAFVFFALFLCLLSMPVVYADATNPPEADFVPEKQGGGSEDEKSNNFNEPFDKLQVEMPLISDELRATAHDKPDKGEAIDNPAAKNSAMQAATEQIYSGASRQNLEHADEDDAEIDDSRLELLSQALTTEKQRLEELELEHKKLFDEVMTKPHSESGVRSQGSGVGIRDSGLTTHDSLTQVPEIDFKGLRPGELKASTSTEDRRSRDDLLLTEPFNADLLGTADGLYKLSQYEAALQTYQSIDPEKASEEDNAWILYQTANCYRILNQVNNALNTYQKLQKKYPNTCPAKEAQWYLDDLNWWKQWHEKIKGLKK